MKLHRLKKTTVLLIMVMLLGNMGGCGPEKSDKAKSRSVSGIPAIHTADFAPYKEVTVNEQADLQPYQVTSDLSNVENQKRFKFSDTARKLLVQNGFVVIPEMNSEYYPLYEWNRYEDVVPNLVTTDSMLHNYHLYFDYLLKTVEQEKLLPELKKLTRGMQQASREQYNSLQNGDWGNAARRNLAFFSVAGRLLDPKSPIPAEVQNEVQAELKLIRQHQQTAVSPVMSLGTGKDSLESLKEDYTQYIPRGHYTLQTALPSFRII
ncbi:MAG TPA: DUF3160 domain-containing protein [Syntrophomonadaceae bacterium]|nr:DUF3160 domain-containing protein [Syntrophomonadaceae bacterium]